MNKQYWIIDTGIEGTSQGTFEARGPYTSVKSAETIILRETKLLWEDSCTCLKTDKTNPWCYPFHIMEVVKTVLPQITAKVTLIDA